MSTLLRSPPAKARVVAVLCAIVATLSTHVSAADLFVDNMAGDDARNGRAPSAVGIDGGPVRSLSRALELALPGDRIVMANSGQPYRESVTISGGRHRALSGVTLTIEGQGATLDGSLPVSPKAWEHVRGDVYRFQPPRQAFAQLFLDARPLVRRPLVSGDGRLPDLNRKEWCLADGWIYFRVEPETLPDEYAISYAALPVGITLYEARGVVIRDLVVQGFQLDGINAHDSVRDALLEGILARGNGRAGVAVGGASHVRLLDCLIGDNGEMQLLIDGQAFASLKQTELLPATAPPIVLRGGRLEIDGQPYDRTLSVEGATRE